MEGPKDGCTGNYERCRALTSSASGASGNLVEDFGAKRNNSAKSSLSREILTKVAAFMAARWSPLPACIACALFAVLSFS